MKGGKRRTPAPHRPRTNPVPTSPPASNRRSILSANPTSPTLLVPTRAPHPHDRHCRTPTSSDLITRVWSATSPQGPYLQPPPLRRLWDAPEALPDPPRGPSLTADAGPRTRRPPRPCALDHLRIAEPALEVEVGRRRRAGYPESKPKPAWTSSAPPSLPATLAPLLTSEKGGRGEEGEERRGSETAQTKGST